VDSASRRSRKGHRNNVSRVHQHDVGQPRGGDDRRSRSTRSGTQVSRRCARPPGGDLPARADRRLERQGRRAVNARRKVTGRVRDGDSGDSSETFRIPALNSAPYCPGSGVRVPEAAASECESDRCHRIFVEHVLRDAGRAYAVAGSARNSAAAAPPRVRPGSSPPAATSPAAVKWKGRGVVGGSG